MNYATRRAMHAQRMYFTIHNSFLSVLGLGICWSVDVCVWFFSLYFPHASFESISFSRAILRHLTFVCALIFHLPLLPLDANGKRCFTLIFCIIYYIPWIWEKDDATAAAAAAAGVVWIRTNVHIFREWWLVCVWQAASVDEFTRRGIRNHFHITFMIYLR